MRCEHRSDHRSEPYPGYNRCSREATRQVGSRWLCTFHANRRERILREREQERGTAVCR